MSSQRSIFIGYRRADSGDAAGRIFDQLESAFGAEHLFKDVDAIPLGVDFRRHVTDVIEKSHIFLLLIGPRWVEKGQFGRSRLWDVDDLVRIEIECALAASGVLVIPTLVSGAEMPARDELPPSIHAITNLNAAIVRQDPDFRKDMAKLIAYLRSLPSQKQKLVDGGAVTARPKGATVQVLPSAKNTTPTNAQPKVVVLGIGGAGGNAVKNMIDAGLRGVDFLALNTDQNALERFPQHQRLHIGEITSGSGFSPEYAEYAANESRKQIRSSIAPYDLIFIATGLGGGTGSGATPVVSRLAKAMKKTVVGVASLPFNFEGERRASVARKALENIEKGFDAIAVLRNQNLFRVANEKTTFAEAFKIADGILYDAIRSVIEPAIAPGPVNLDFEDLIRILNNFGRVSIGVATHSSETAAANAALNAANSPLLETPQDNAADRVLLSIAGPRSLTLLQIDRVAEVIRAAFPRRAELLVGSSVKEIDADVTVSLWANGRSIN